MEEIHKTILDISHKIDALKNTLPISGYLYTSIYEHLSEEFGNFLEEKCEKKEGNDDEPRYKIPEKRFTEFIRFKEKIEKAKISLKIVPHSFIIMLLSQYDLFISELIKYTLHEIPEILDSSEKNLSFKILKEIGSIDEAKEYIIDNEIESIIRCSHDDHLKWFENKLKITLRSDKEILARFFELTERRNLLTHCGGIVNDSYIKNCKKHNYEFCDDIKKGDYLDVSHEYFINSCDLVLEICVKISSIIWNKVNPDEKIKIIINSIAFDLIKNQNYILAINILEFGINNFKNLKNLSNDLVLSINLAQCHLWLGDKAKVNDIVNKIDWSSCSHDYLIARNVLIEDYPEAIRQMDKLSDDSIIDKDALIEWPLFKELRRTEEFKDFFERQYGEQFAKKEEVKIKAEFKVETLI